MPTQYKVCRRVTIDSEEYLAEIGQATASGPVAAVKEVVGDAPGRFVAVPSRNWSEVGGEEHTETRTRWSLSAARPAPDVHPGQTTLTDEDDKAEEAVA